MNPIPQVNLLFTPGDFKTLRADILHTLFDTVDKIKEKQEEMRQEILGHIKSGDADKAVKRTIAFVKFLEKNFEDVVLDRDMVEILKIENIILDELKTLVKDLKGLHKKINHRNSSLKDLKGVDVGHFDDLLKHFLSVIQTIENSLEKSEIVIASEVDRFAAGQQPSSAQSHWDAKKVEEEIGAEADRLGSVVDEFKNLVETLDSLANNIIKSINSIITLEKDIKKFTKALEKEEDAAKKQRIQHSIDESRQKRDDEIGHVKTFEAEFEELVKDKGPFVKTIQDLNQIIENFLNYSVIFIYYVFDFDLVLIGRILKQEVDAGLGEIEDGDKFVKDIEKERKEFYDHARKDARNVRRLLQFEWRKIKRLEGQAKV